MFSTGTAEREAICPRFSESSQLSLIGSDLLTHMVRQCEERWRFPRSEKLVETADEASNQIGARAFCESAVVQAKSGDIVDLSHSEISVVEELEVRSDHDGSRGFASETSDATICWKNVHASYEARVVGGTGFEPVTPAM